MNTEAALAYIAATIDTYMDGDCQMVLQPSSYVYGGWDAKLHDVGAADPHVEVRGIDGMDKAIQALAKAIREESDIGA